MYKLNKNISRVGLNHLGQTHPTRRVTQKRNSNANSYNININRLGNSIWYV